MRPYPGRKDDRCFPLNGDNKMTCFLNCYEISNTPSLSWHVALYRVEKVDGQLSSHSDRNELKNLFWDLRAEFKDSCPGYGFIIRH